MTVSRVLFMKLENLSPNDRNPRRITDEKLKMLKKSLETFGDLSGFVYNQVTKRLVGGHMRRRVLPNDSEVIVEHRLETPNEQGTIATGYVLIGNERYAYREVAFDETTEKAANIAANQQGGEFDFPLLAEDLLALDSMNIDMDLTGFSPEELENIFAPVGEIEESGPRPTMKDKFIVPPFSILDARQGYWQDRKRQWIALGIKSEIGRGGASTLGVGSEQMDTNFAERERERVAAFKSQGALEQFRRTKKTF